MPRATWCLCCGAAGTGPDRCVTRTTPGWNTSPRSTMSPLRYTLLPLTVVVEDVFAGETPDAYITLSDDEDAKKRGELSRATRSLLSNMTQPLVRSLSFLQDRRNQPAKCYGAGAFAFPRSPPKSAVKGQPLWAGTKRESGFYLSSFRSRMWAAFSGGAPPQRDPSAPVRIALIARKGVWRNIVGAERLLGPGGGGKWVAERVDWAQLPLRQQPVAAAGYDVLVGVHGNNNGWVVALRPGSVLVELCPEGCPLASGINANDDARAAKYGIGFFADLSRHLQVTHIGWRAPRNMTEYPDVGPHLDKAAQQFWALRCHGKIAKRYRSWWLCRNVILPPPTFECIMAAAAARVAAFDGETAALGCGGAPGDPP
eukprot:TRINITY_DN34718_c0_g1_i1.p2 TRINITY_DN34718_c0_g1~~TRINITY_DN34718_c0_g1_i1.p2  ORF type:complete len:370 (+),score=77.66 TRINITY_DN34718_c0_g1_i1:823-1932(+)